MTKRLTPEEEHQARMMDELTADYEGYKNNHPDFKRVVEEEERKRLSDNGSIFGDTGIGKRRFDNHHYEFLELHKDTFVITVDFTVNRDRLRILEKICDLKYFGVFPELIETALQNQVERDLKEPETMAKDYCAHLFKEWIGYPARRRQRLSDEIDR